MHGRPDSGRPAWKVLFAHFTREARRFDANVLGSKTQHPMSG